MKKPKKKGCNPKIYALNKGEQPMNLYNHLAYKEAKVIINLKNQNTSHYAVAKVTSISVGKVKRCAELARYEKGQKPRVNQPWKRLRIYYGYSLKKWKAAKVEIQSHKKKTYAQKSEAKLQEFITFMHRTFNQRVLGTRVKWSALIYLYLWNQMVHLESKTPSKSLVYHMVKSSYYKQVKPLMFPNKGLYQRDRVPKGEQNNKFIPIDQRQGKQLLIKKEGHCEADSVIGKRTDKKAIASLTELKSGKVRLSFYQRDANSFACSIKRNCLRMRKPFKSWTINNGKENNKLDKEFANDKIYNCHAYCSWAKGSVENMHRLVKRIIFMHKFLNSYTDLDLQQVENFINVYYRPLYQNV